MSGINFKQNPITIMKDKDGPGFGFIVVGHGASLTFQSFAKCDGCGLGCKSEVKLDLFNPGGNLAGMSWRTTLPKDWRSVPGPENSGTTVDTCPDCIAKTP